MATESGGTRPATNETAVTGGLMYKDEGPYTLPHRSSLSRSSPAIAIVLSPVSSPSDDDEGVTGRLSDAAAAAAYRTNPNHAKN